MDNNIPKVSIVIVNYNGYKYLGACLSSVRNLTYPKKSYEIIVVDNASSDSSVAFIKKNFPEVFLLELPENVGFAGGNNRGIERATGEYIVFLNNDTVVDPEWLTQLVYAANPSEVGVVTSKIYFAIPYVRVQITSTVVQQSELDNSADFSPRGALLEKITVESDENVNVWYESGFEEEKVVRGISLRWTAGSAAVLLPISKEVNSFSVVFHGYSVRKELPLKVQLSMGSKILLETTIPAREIEKHTITLLREEVAPHLIKLVQNAGNVILADGYSKDRGSTLTLTESERLEFYEPDSQIFDQPVEVSAACGAAMLVKRAVIDQIGAFDGHYFMYYEDIDFSLRAWRMHWHIMYAPLAQVYHAHRGTTGKDETSFFIKMTEKNHLLLVFTHYPLRTCVREYFKLVSRALYSQIKQFSSKFVFWSQYSLWRTRATGRIEALITFHTLLPVVLQNRLFWMKNGKRPLAEISKIVY